MITECGRTEKRRPSLPARSMAYFAMGMALHSEGSYEDVVALISDGLAWAHRDDRSGRLANRAAISRARDRLGHEPMALLFSRVAKPLAVADTSGCCWRAGDWFAPVISPYTTSENAASAELLGRLEPGMLWMADRGFYGFNAWEKARGTGADLLWRVEDNLKLESVEDLPHGS